MSRKLRIEYPGAMYHVMNRGDQAASVLTFDTVQCPPAVEVATACGPAVAGVPFPAEQFDFLSRLRRQAEMGQTEDLPQEGQVLGRRWHVRGCCLRPRSDGHAGRVAG
jgi:hypothetical protein